MAKYGSSKIRTNHVSESCISFHRLRSTYGSGKSHSVGDISPCGKNFLEYTYNSPGSETVYTVDKAISNVRYLDFRGISNFFLGPFSIYGLLSYKMSRYLEFRYLEII